MGARDTYNAALTDACIAFVDSAEKKRDHDGTKTTLNIFTEGQYVHHKDDGEWEVHKENSAREWVLQSTGITPLSSLGAEHIVAYKAWSLGADSCPLAKNS